MLGITDAAGQPVFPTGGTRVRAYPAPHFAIADGGAAGREAGLTADDGFVYLHLRRGRRRSAAVHQQAGQKLDAVAKAHFAPLRATRPVGVTLQIDEGPEVFDASNSLLHSLCASTAATACGASGRRGGRMGDGLATAACSATRTGLAAPFLRSLRLTRRMHGWRCVANLLPVRRGVGL